MHGEGRTVEFNASCHEVATVTRPQTLEILDCVNDIMEQQKEEWLDTNPHLIFIVEVSITDLPKIVKLNKRRKPMLPMKFSDFTMAEVVVKTDPD